MSRKRLLRWVKYLPVFIVLFGIGGLVGQREMTRAKGKELLAAQIAALDRDDPQWPFEQIDCKRPLLRDDENNALLVPKFAAAFPKPNFDSNETLHNETTTETPPNQRYPVIVYETLAPRLKNNEPALTLAHAFKGLPKGQFKHQVVSNYISTPLPHVQETRTIVWLLDWHAEGLLWENRHAEAMTTPTAMWNVSHALADDPFYVSALTRMALVQITVKRLERLLGLGLPTSADLDRWQKELEAEATADLFWHALRAERGGMSMLFDEVRTGAIDLSAVSHLASDGQATTPALSQAIFGKLSYSPYMGHDHAKFLELMSRAYEVRRLPEDKQRAALQALDDEVKGLREQGLKYLLTCSLMPALSKLYEASARTKAHLRCALLAVACERFRRQHQRWPHTLAELPGALTAYQNDPFSGQPLRYRKRPNGVTIYSVGPDGSDDHGTLFAVPPGVGVKFDNGFRLYNPEERDRPAK